MKYKIIYEQRILIKNEYQHRKSLNELQYWLLHIFRVKGVLIRALLVCGKLVLLKLTLNFINYVEINVKENSHDF